MLSKTRLGDMINFNASLLMLFLFILNSCSTEKCFDNKVIYLTINDIKKAFTKSDTLFLNVEVINNVNHSISVANEQWVSTLNFSDSNWLIRVSSNTERLFLADDFFLERRNKNSSDYINLDANERRSFVFKIPISNLRYNKSNTKFEMGNVTIDIAYKSAINCMVIESNSQTFIVN